MIRLVMRQFMGGQHEPVKDVTHLCARIGEVSYATLDTTLGNNYRLEWGWVPSLPGTLGTAWWSLEGFTVGWL